MTSNSATASLRLVGLQRADQMQLDVGKACLQRRPFALRLLHAVLAEDALAGLEDRPDVVGSKVLETATSVTAPASRPASLLGGGDLRLDRENCSNGVAHMPIPLF